MASSSYSHQVVWIIGASSGIGAALAAELAARGATLALSARRHDALHQLQRQLGSQHIAVPLDVAEAEDIIRAAESIYAAYGRLDRVIFLSAAYVPMRLDALDLAATRTMLETNLLGAFYVIHAVLPLLKKQGNGQIALCGSVAGYTGLPSGQPYSAAKAGIINLAESLHAEAPDYLDIKLINPGFVRSELTDKNSFKMPMIISAEAAAKAIAKGLLVRSFEIHFPKAFTLWLKLLRLLPNFLALPLTRKCNF